MDFEIDTQGKTASIEMRGHTYLFGAVRDFAIHNISIDQETATTLKLSVSVGDDSTSVKIEEGGHTYNVNDLIDISTFGNEEHTYTVTSNGDAGEVDTKTFKFTKTVAVEDLTVESLAINSEHFSYGAGSNTGNPPSIIRPFADNTEKPTVTEESGVKVYGFKAFGNANGAYDGTLVKFPSPPAGKNAISFYFKSSSNEYTTPAMETGFDTAGVAKASTIVVKNADGTVNALLTEQARKADMYALAQYYILSYEDKVTGNKTKVHVTTDGGNFIGSNTAWMKITVPFSKLGGKPPISMLVRSHDGSVKSIKSITWETV